MLCVPPPGSYNFTLSVTGNGRTAESARLIVDVTPKVVGSNNVSAYIDVASLAAQSPNTAVRLSLPGYVRGYPGTNLSVTWAMTTGTLQGSSGILQVSYSNGYRLAGRRKSDKMRFGRVAWQGLTTSTVTTPTTMRGVVSGGAIIPTPLVLRANAMLPGVAYTMVLTTSSGPLKGKPQTFGKRCQVTSSNTIQTQ